MVTLTVQPAAWEWAWGQTETVHGITHPSLFTRRREKIETINYPPLRTNIPVKYPFITLFNILHRNQCLCTMSLKDHAMDNKKIHFCGYC